MYVRRSFLSRRITSRSFSLSKSSKELETLEIPQIKKEVVEDGDPDGMYWSSMLPEILGDIIKRVEATKEQWPSRQNVVARGCVCKRWRDVTREIVRSPFHGGKISFPSSRKQSGPRESPLQFIIKRNKKYGTFYLYLAPTPSWRNTGKFLLAARRHRNGAHTEYIISLDTSDLSQGSNAYVGKLSSDFLGTNFTIYDSQPPHTGAKPSSSRVGPHFSSKQISPQVSTGTFEVGQVTYKFNLRKSRGLRWMVCSLNCPWSAETVLVVGHKPQEEDSNMKPESSFVAGQTVLRNKAPRWHENLQCWCLNFHDRVTVVSVKNFVLVATMDQSQEGGKGDEKIVLLQLGKVGDDIFTMDYRQPLSAFQAFAICLTSFGTKQASE